LEIPIFFFKNDNDCNLKGVMSAVSPTTLALLKQHSVHNVILYKTADSKYGNDGELWARVGALEVG
jgi:hypothetical protein